MGDVIKVYCAETTHEGRRSHVATLERLHAGTDDEFWAATHLAGDRGIVRGLDKQTRDGRVIVDDQLYREVFEDAATRPSTLTMVLRCDHPMCGLDWQRREPAARQVLNKLADGGVSEISLRQLARLAV